MQNKHKYFYNNPIISPVNDLKTTQQNAYKQNTGVFSTDLATLFEYSS